VRTTIAVASGKGGTGKTTMAVALALAVHKRVEGLQFLDCDVEEPNAGILMKPAMDGTIPVTVRVPRVDSSRCTGCGTCSDICHYNAIAVVGGKALIFENICHSCGGCGLVCPERAVTEVDREIGRVEKGAVENIRFLQGVLNVGEPMATPVIRLLRALATADLPTVLDAPPGTACPVITTIKDCAFVLLVTEPTPFGLYDLDLMVKMIRELGIPGGVVINKDDAWSANIEHYASDAGLPILLRIPFSRTIAMHYSNGIPLNEVDASWDERLWEIYERIGEMV
jgi:MinD superfamily P-loop ATPase